MNAGIRTVYGDNRIPLIKIFLPGDWTAEADVYPDTATGYGEPQFMIVTCTSMDNRARIYFQSSFHYRDDHLDRGKTGYDSYGILHRGFMTAEQYTDMIASGDLEGVQDVRLIHESDWNTNQKQLEYYRKQVDAYAGDDPYTVPGEIYCKGIQRVYTYSRGGMRHYRIYSLIIKAADYAYWAQIPPEITASLDDPVMGQNAKAFLTSFANARYDEAMAEWIYTYLYYKDWRVDQCVILDCTEDRFERTYSSVFQPLVRHGVYYTEELQRITRTRQEELNTQLRRKRAEEERISKARKAEQERRRADEQRQRERDSAARQKYQQAWRRMGGEVRGAMFDTQRVRVQDTRELRNEKHPADTEPLHETGNTQGLRFFEQYAYSPEEDVLPDDFITDSE